MASRTPDPISHFDAASLPISEAQHFMIKPNRMFAILELLRLISTSLSRKDAFHFSQCSRIFFHAAAGRMWSSIPYIYCLVNLLPMIEDDATSEPSDISTRDFERLEFYAPLVVHLELFWEPFDYNNTADWTRLIQYARHKTLLPNLRHLDFNSDAAVGKLSWLTIFLSPSLLSILGSEDRSVPTTDVHQVTQLFEDIALRCPALEELSIVELFAETHNPLALPIPSPVLPFYCHLGSMQNLRSLRTNVTICEVSALGILGSLPHLETLEISEMSLSCFVIPTPNLPNSAFLALRELWLSNLDPSELTGIWRIQRLVTRPVVVKITPSEFETNLNVEALLRDISQYSPQIVDLTITLERTAEGISPEIILLLKPLRLEKLSLFKLSLISLATMCETFSVACPLLRELRIADLRVSVSDLRYFGQLSRLEMLSVSVDWQSCSALNQLVPEPAFVSMVFQQLDGCESLHSFAEPALIGKTIQYLHSFWPRLGFPGTECLINNSMMDA
ncbi:hypothetical protein BDV93DRAFT_528366 [Ceratobasidium sp. AG-I]|nr:hypothetical protein BDV93DRAFT_528366 [Ceratobasidium sp. AG-I]